MSSLERCAFAVRYASIALEIVSCITGFTATGADAERRLNASFACGVHQLASASASGKRGETTIWLGCMERVTPPQSFCEGGGWRGLVVVGGIVAWALSGSLAIDMIE